ncbi:hypothetical protein Cpir12675_000992 [Ceratocystis pirilliformis]|uniref:Uncharacterized protein n=1 Tax=Ceratocystis pirilliformis TaxID=259994 RepID=A0ABR3ZJ14_9PEZI
MLNLLNSLEARCEREKSQMTAEAIKYMILSGAQGVTEPISSGREGGWKRQPASKPTAKPLEKEKAEDKTPSSAPGRKKAPSFADMSRRAASKSSGIQSPAKSVKSYEAAKQGGQW